MVWAISPLPPIESNGASVANSARSVPKNAWPQAVAAYEMALRDDPNAVATYARLAEVYLETARYRDAVDLLSTAVEKFPGDASLLARRR